VLEYGPIRRSLIGTAFSEGGSSSVPVAIVGAHRSGTSLLASWLQQSGLTISTGRTVGSGPGNPDGHFEDNDFVRLQGWSIRRRLGHHTRGWLIDVDRQLAFPAPARMAARFIVAYRNVRYSPRRWGWKDPRTISFLEEWVRLIPSLKIVAIWRPRAEVVGSLLRRSAHPDAIDFVKVDRDRAAALWDAQNSALRDAVRRYADRTVLFSLEQLTSRPDRIAASISALVPAIDLIDFGRVYRSSNLATHTGAGPTTDIALEQELMSLSTGRV
jgi:hypothetical protein